MTLDNKVSYAFQPIVDVDAKRVFSYEALIRGKYNESPAVVFSEVAAAELADFDQRSRNVALALAAQLGIDCHLNLNFMPSSIEGSGQHIRDTLDTAIELGLEPAQVIIEVTESDVIKCKQTFRDTVNHYRAQGITVAIDDFGAGYSGLNLLAQFQPDIVKLDMALVQNIDGDGPRQAIVRAVGQVCEDLGIDIIAEGVERPEEYTWLREQGFHLFQGYLFARPGFESLPEVYYPD